jgi:DNA-binding NarL/FixJ family response regulator
VVKARVLLADDHVMVVEAFKKLLEPEFEVVGVATAGRKLLQLAQQTRPEVVLLDLEMPSLNGFDAGRQLKKLLPAIKIVVVTMNEDIDTAEAALREYASGYLLKSSASRADLSRAIVTVMTGNRYLSPGIAGMPLCCSLRSKSRSCQRTLNRPEANQQWSRNEIRDVSFRMLQ